MYVAMLDLDKFKAINDTYGHKVGDDVLKDFVKIVQNSLDEQDIIGRIGGEEFALVMPCLCSQQVVAKLEKSKMMSLIL